MAADVFYHPLYGSEPEEIVSRLIADSQIGRTATIGDRLGNPIFVAASGEIVQFCIGRIDEETETAVSFTVLGTPRTLMPGEIDQMVVYNGENGEEYLLHIRNLGNLALIPKYN